MLNEILKGMDNAAEQINENFQHGSIIDSGGDSNGEWIKFGNGWQICIRTFDSINLPKTTAIGQLYRSPKLDWTYPAPFINRPTFFPSTSGTWGSWASPFESPTETGASYGILTFESTTSVETISLLAIGRWK